MFQGAWLLSLADAAATEPSLHFALDAWMPSGRQFLHALTAGGSLLAAGLIVFGLLRRSLARARLVTPFFVLLGTLAAYGGLRFLRPERFADPLDLGRLWVHRVVHMTLLYVGIAWVSRLVLVPVLTRGGRTALPRFVHQIALIVISLFAILGYGSWEFGWDIDKFLAGSAVVSIVLGLALQETLGNFFSGLVMQASSPFSLGDWIICAGVEGRVVDMTWRAVTLHTPDDNFVHIPNATIAKEQIVNYNTPTTATARVVRVGLEYELAPLEALEVLKAAALETPGVLATPEPYVYLEDYASSAIVYRVKFWINNPPMYPKIEHMVRLNIWYRLRQKGFNIPFQIQTVEMVNLDRKLQRIAREAAGERLRAIEATPLFASLSAAEKQTLAASSVDVLLAPGQVLMQQDAPGESFYLIRQGSVEVLIRQADGSQQSIATLGPGTYVGEMSALTGEPRTATVRAASSLACVEVRKQDLQAIIAANPAILESISLVIAKRNAERRAAMEHAPAKPAAVAEQQRSLLGRMFRFFGLGGSLPS